jgi:hypothetical protein
MVLLSKIQKQVFLNRFSVTLTALQMIYRTSVTSGGEKIQNFFLWM